MDVELFLKLWVSLEKMRAYSAEEAKEFLFNAGIIDEKGQLREEYKQ